jgi:dephospho-CoA kinase
MAKKRKKAVLIGVTGQIGAGKSTVAKILASVGCKVVSGDELGRQVLERSITVRKQLVKAFGDDLLLSNGKINRAKLAKRAFASEPSLQTLNRIVHPPLLKELDRQIRITEQTESVVIIDATLLIEWGYHRKMDETVVVTAPRALRHLRLRGRGISQGDIKARESQQLTESQFRKYATKIVRNSGDAGALRARVISWLRDVQNCGVDSQR